MNRIRSFLAGAVPAALMLWGGATVAQAQAWNHPSFQPPRVSPREFTIGIAEAGGPGTSLVFQWRQPLSPRASFAFNIGMADPDWGGHDTRLLVGGQYGQQLAGARADQPIDVLLTFGVFGSFGDPYSLVRVPVGVSLGHRFPLEGQLAVTPYVHPRVNVDYCSRCGRDGTVSFAESDTDIALDFDLGASFEFTPRLALRISALFSGSDLLANHNGFGLALAWQPGTARTR